jgi:hypothetical protein
LILLFWADNNTNNQKEAGGQRETARVKRREKRGRKGEGKNPYIYKERR